MDNERTAGVPPADQALMTIAGAIAINKKNAGQCAKELTARVFGGRLKGTDVWARLSFLEEVAEAFKTDTMKAHIAAEIAKDSSGTGKLIVDGGTFATRAVAAAFDFQGDAVLADLEIAVEALKEQIARRKEYLKALPATTVEKYRGENVQVVPPVRTSRDGFAFTMNK